MQRSISRLQTLTQYKAYSDPFTQITVMSTYGMGASNMGSAKMRSISILRPRAPVSFLAARSAMAYKARRVKNNRLGYVSKRDLYWATKLFLGSVRMRYSSSSESGVRAQIL